MRVGLHVHVAGGHVKAVEHAKAVGATAMQVFSSNPRSYRTTAIDISALEAFARLRRDANLDPCAIHTPYLINFASADPKISQGSLRLLQHDLAAAARGGMRFVNTHLGSYGTRDRAGRLRGDLPLVGGRARGYRTGRLSRTRELGRRGKFGRRDVGRARRLVRALPHPQLGICLDTAHAWATGYEIDSKAGVDRFIEEASNQIGIDRLLMFHFNDTQVPLGASRDRHWHIGEGNIGFEGFRALLAHPELRDKTAILETPGTDEDDLRNMQTIRSILRGVLSS